MTGAAPAKRRISHAVMTAYGFGAVAYGVKDSGFGTFLLLFYNQVVGLPSATVGAVIMAALVIDAFIDPAVGFASDRTRSRWGRRHPWMYASALPIMVAYYLLWNPPSGQAALVWLFVCAVVVRTAVSCYEVPSVALTPELSSDYDERTRIMAWRYLFGWAGGLGVGLLAWAVFLAPRAGERTGMLNREGYADYALASALLMGTAILVSALGTHREIPNLPQPEIPKQRLRDLFADLLETLRNRAFAILLLAGLCTYTNQGIAYALGNYLNGFVWGFTSRDFSILTVCFLISATAAFIIAPRLGRGGSKAGIAATVVVLGGLIGTTHYWLRVAGLAPPPGTREAVALAIVCPILGTAFNITGFILGASMMADVVEDSEDKTGRRSEGLFFAGAFFVQKCTSGIGIFASSLMLAAAGFPEKAVPGQVPAATLDRLSLIYAVTYVTLALAAAFIFTRFPFGRDEHEARLARLASAPAPGPIG